MSGLRIIYLGLAIWGAVHPMLLTLRHLRDAGGGISGLVDTWFANAATAGLAWDLLIASVALCVWVIAETAVRHNWLALLAIPVTFGIGLSCGLPLYLWLRTRPVA